MAAPELRLNVTLDLAAFRTQLGKLAQTSASQFYPVKLTIDQRNFKLQLAQLSKIKPVININDSQLEGARIRIGTLNKSLATLRRATAAPIEIKLKYTEVGKPPSAAAGQIGRAVSGGIRADQSVAELNRAQAVAARNMMKAANMPVGSLGTGRSLEAYKKSITEGMVNAGKESIAGLAQGLKDGQSAIGQAAKKVGDEGVRAIKDTLGIKSPSEIYKQIGRFSVGGLEIGFLDRLKDFKSKSVAEIKKIVALMRFELAKVSDLSGTGGPSMGSLRQRLAGQRAYTSPIGPLPVGSSQPYAQGTRGQFGYSGYEPRMVSRPYTGTPRFPVEGMIAPRPEFSAASMGQSVLGGASTGRARENTFLGAVGGYNPGVRSSALFPMSGMMGPSSPLGRITPQSSMFAGGGGGGPVGGGAGGGGGGPLGGMQFNVPNLPGAGLVREIGTEFGFAAKQVLLFGTAYKALAFIQGFPAQVGAAVGALQSFRNTLGAISPSAEEAAESSQFILDVVDKYNTPIQSARDGFTKLYASMKPTGFSGDEIRDLFLGISQAAATFGMSAEKVDRVNYAFAQMASKGQVMSEELKGQLGDVLPGAMGIFAEAAGFEGPDAITKFSKALEDGAYKGAAMKTLLVNVTSIMKKEFGPGAEGAARTFQGVMNRMQNSAKLLYEAFEPVAVGFLNSVVMPMTSGIKTLTDGFNAFFTGTLAKTEGGAAFAQQLNNLKPSFEGIRANLAALIPSFQTFGQLLLGVAQFLTQLAGNPITGFLLKVYTNVLLVNTAFTLLGGRILLGLIANVNAAIIRFVAFGYAINAVGIQTTGANTALAGTQLQMMLLQRNAGAALAPVNALLGSLARIAAIGAIAIVLTVAISNYNQLVDAEARLNRLRGAKSESVVGPQGPRPVQTAQERFRGATRETIEDVRGKQTAYLVDLALKRKKAEKALQMAQGLAFSADPDAASQIEAQRPVKIAKANLDAIDINIKDANEVLRLDPRNYPRQGATGGVAVTGGGVAGDGAGGKAEKERESRIPQLMLQLEKTKELSGIEMQIVNAQLANNTAQLSALELAKQLVNFKYEEKELELQKLTIGEQSIAKKEIGIRREQAILASQLQLQIDFRKEREAVQEGFVAILAGYDEEFEYQQMYLNLINQGVRPSLAKARVEVEKTFKAQEKTLDTLIDQNKANIAGLEVDIARFKLKKELSPIEKQQLDDAEARLKAAKDELAVRTGMKAVVPETKAAAMQKVEQGLAPKTASEYIGEGEEAAEDKLEELMNTGYQVVQAANAIGDAFGEAFKGVITGSMTAQQALAGMFRSIADHFADMVAQMIAEYLKMALIKGLMSIVGGAAGAIGSGVGSAFADSAGGAAGFSGSFDAGIAPLPNIPNYSGAFKTAANGAIWGGGFTAFANGGMVTGPTLGLVGEGRYNEAIIPLPDGKSVPVQLSGGAGGNAAPINTNIVVNVKNGQAESQTSGSQGNQLARELEGAVRQVILKESRPGGLISSSR